jgi:hypothetical protein
LGYTRSKRAIWGVCAAVTLAVLLAVAVTAYFLFPRMPTIERKGESNLTLQLTPFVLNFTENFVVDNPNYVSLSVHVRLAPSTARACGHNTRGTWHTHARTHAHAHAHAPPHAHTHKTQQVLTHTMFASRAST